MSDRTEAMDNLIAQDADLIDAQPTQSDNNFHKLALNESFERTEIETKGSQHNLRERGQFQDRWLVRGWSYELLLILGISQFIYIYIYMPSISLSHMITARHTCTPIMFLLLNM